MTPLPPYSRSTRRQIAFAPSAMSAGSLGERARGRGPVRLSREGRVSPRSSRRAVGVGAGPAYPWPTAVGIGALWAVIGRAQLGQFVRDQNRKTRPRKNAPGARSRRPGGPRELIPPPPDTPAAAPAPLPIRPAFALLQWRHAATRFSIVVTPPRLSGSTWSALVARPVQPRRRSRQRYPSRSSTSRRSWLCVASYPRAWRKPRARS